MNKPANLLEIFNKEVKSEKNGVCTYHIIGSVTTYVFDTKTGIIQTCVFGKPITEIFAPISPAEFFNEMKKVALIGLRKFHGVN